jgi:hypothetical protein
MTDAFEDDLTRELPSALRTFTDLEPFEAVADEDILEVESRDLQKTLQLPPVSRPLSIPAFTRDVVLLPRTFSPTETLGLAGAFLLACLVVGAAAFLVGRASSGREHASVVVDARVPRTSIVLAAHEQIIEPPLTAPAKLEVEELVPVPIATPVVRPQPPAPPRIEPRRAGFQRPASLTRR